MTRCSDPDKKEMEDVQQSDPLFEKNDSFFEKEMDIISERLGGVHVPTVSDYGYDLKVLATDVLNNWAKEKAGRTDYVRCLPKEYLYYGGDGIHNYFRTSYLGGTRWDYSYGYPYG
jgi:hypothetical protein